MNMRDWLELGRPTEPPRRVVLERIVPEVEAVRCVVCRKPLVASRCQWFRPGDYRASSTLDVCSWRCALVVVERGELR
jgi:hypothetical protein